MSGPVCDGLNMHGGGCPSRAAYFIGNIPACGRHLAQIVKRLLVAGRSVSVTRIDW